MDIWPYRVDLPDRMEALLAADPGCGLAYCLKGYLLLMSFRADLLGAARAALAEARRCSETAREMAHAEALARWIDGDPEAAVAVWDLDPGGPSARHPGLPPGAIS